MKEKWRKFNWLASKFENYHVIKTSWENNGTSQTGCLTSCKTAKYSFKFLSQILNFLIYRLLPHSVQSSWSWKLFYCARFEKETQKNFFFPFNMQSRMLPLFFWYYSSFEQKIYVHDMIWANLRNAGDELRGNCDLLR